LTKSAGEFLGNELKYRYSSIYICTYLIHFKSDIEELFFL
jgi:hypothetical protein